MGSNHEKYGGRKYHDSLPLTYCIHILYMAQKPNIQYVNLYSIASAPPVTVTDFVSFRDSDYFWDSYTYTIKAQYEKNQLSVTVFSSILPLST